MTAFDTLLEAGRTLLRAQAGVSVTLRDLNNLPTPCTALAAHERTEKRHTETGIEYVRRRRFTFSADEVDPQINWVVDDGTDKWAITEHPARGAVNIVIDTEHSDVHQRSRPGYRGSR